MTGERFLYLISNVDPDLIEEAEDLTFAKKKLPIYLKYGALAACVCLAVLSAVVMSKYRHLDTEPQPDPPVVTEPAPSVEPDPIDPEHVAPDPLDPDPSAPDPKPALPGGLYGLDYVLVPSPNPAVYPECSFSENPATTGAFSYDIFAEDSRYMSTHSLVRLKIISAYVPEEAYLITGDDAFIKYATLFKAEITYDYLHDRPLNLEINLSHAGLADRQIEGLPLYAPGEEYVAMLSTGEEDRYVAKMEFAIHSVNGVELAYQVGDEYLKLESEFVSTVYPNLDLAMDESERWVVTSTSNNPVHYTYKMTVDDLVGFIREDWLARGFNFEGFTMPDTDNSANWHNRFDYHDVEIEELPPLEFSIPSANQWFEEYIYSEVKDELLADKDGLRLIEFEVEASSSADDGSNGTLYDIKILRDCLSGEDVEETATLWHYGDGNVQYNGYPVFRAGERFMAAVYEENGVLKPIYDLEFLIAKSPFEDRVYAYHLGYFTRVEIVIDGYDLETGLGEIEAAPRGSTENNYYWLTQKFIPERLEEYLRDNWTE